jgi:hypothetical protein
MESFAGFRFFKVAGSVFDFNGLRVLLQANPRYLLLVVLTARDVVDENDENDNAFASSREDEVLLNLREEREPPPPPIPVTPLEHEDEESVVTLIFIALLV